MLATRFTRLFGLKSRRKLPRQRRPLMIDMLEDRRLLATLYVDDDHAQMPNAGFTSIQAAVNAAHAGDTIRVLPGTYNESVTVDKQLTILGSQSDVKQEGKQDNGKGNDEHDNNGRGPNNHKNPHANKTPQPSIVEIPAGGTAGFNLTANDIVIRGFTIQDSDANGNNAVGVNTSRQTSGDVISNNIIQDTVFGIYLNTNGAHTTTVQNNLIRNNNNPGAASGNGIYSDQGASNVVIAHNMFTGQTNASIIFVGGPDAATSQSNITVTDNSMINDAPMIFVNTTGLQITKNVSTNSVGSGIFFGGGVSNAVVQNNTLTNGAFTGINLRTNTFGNAPTPNNNIQIVGNTISGFGDDGIRLSAGANNILVSKNKITGNHNDGIALEGELDTNNNLVNGPHDNRIEQNTLQKNAHDGIFADASAVNNLFSKNEAKGNGLYDYEDQSHGTGTAGTANTWTKNKGKTASPPGLIAK
jgi:parallel beta-helix repeat protein